MRKKRKAKNDLPKIERKRKQLNKNWKNISKPKEDDDFKKNDIYSNMIRLPGDFYRG
jgi:hypothetical protein